MPIVHIVCGATGAGKTTYSMALAERERAIRFSIDPWMQTLFAADQRELSFEWMMERVQRCESTMWQLADQLLARGTDVVLDLGFTLRAHRDAHRARAAQRGASARVHFIDVPAGERRARVAQRNRDRDPNVFAFEVTEQMFDFMEPRFEPPAADELTDGVHVRSA